MIDLAGVKLVVFDVDGTLYDQRALRLRMAAALLRHCLFRGDFAALAVLRDYRREREAFAEAGVEQFGPKLIEGLAERYRKPKSEIAAVVAEWIDRRPLPYLDKCRYPGVIEAFERLRASGRTVAILSDYPAVDKLAAMALTADLVVSATDPEVGVLKPSTRGLERVMSLAGVGPAETIMVGDRAERDGEMARAAGVRCYLRASQPVAGWEVLHGVRGFPVARNG